MNTPRQYPLVVALVLGVACSDNRVGPTPPPPPPPAVVTQAMVSLSTPYSDDGAIVISVKGPDLSTFEPVSPFLLYSRVASAQEARLIVIGDITDGPLFTIKFSVAHELSAYTVSVEQVAMRSDTLRADLSGYGTRLTGSSP